MRTEEWTDGRDGMMIEEVWIYMQLGWVQITIGIKIIFLFIFDIPFKTFKY